MRPIRLLPGPADIAFLLLLLSATVLRGWQAINTDGDLGRHLRVGETILDRGGLFFEDQFSWTMAGQPFVPYEWLSEVLFAGAYRAAGFPGVVVFSGLVIAASYLLLFLMLRRLGADPLLGFVVTIGAGLAGSFHWLARPHVFTFAGTVATLWLLERRRRTAGPSRTDLLWAVGLFAVWANLHGGFLFGLVLIGMYVAGNLLDNRGGVPRTGLILAGAVVGSLLNPTGPRLLAHVTGYLGKTFLVNTTLEYQSPDFHVWFARVFLSLLLLAVAGLALSRRTIGMARLIAFLGTTAFALHSARNIPLWALSGLPAVVLHLDADWRGLGARLVRFREAFSTADRVSLTGVWSALGVVAVLLLAGTGGRLAGVQLLPARLDASVFPIEAVDRARRAGLTGRIFNELTWGGYVLHAWPEQKVFIDGQTDFYGETLAKEYVAIRAADDGWRDRLRDTQAALVLLPPDSPLIRALASEPGWDLWHTDGTAVILRRGP